MGSMAMTIRDNSERFDLDQLLHPAQAFGHPSEVVNDPDLTLNEKRAILASWASDACAMEDVPELRTGPKVPVPFDDIIEALRSLDKQANGVSYRNPVGLRLRRRTSRGDSSDQGQPLQ